MFVKELEEQGCGVTIRDGEVWLTSELKPPTLPVAMKDFLWSLNHIRKTKARVDGIKVAVTGPLTLATTTKVTESKTALEYPDLILSFADVVKGIVRYFCEENAAIITIDEPTLPCALWMGLSNDLIIKSIDKTLEPVKRQIKSIHVCGKINEQISQLLLQTDASVLCHEFKAFPPNLNFYKKSDLEKYDKMLGLGCVQTKPINDKLPVETVEEVKNFTLKAMNKFSSDRLLLVPDCGFKGLLAVYKNEVAAQRIATEKMATMVFVARALRR
jgi:methionine synthase II (cobalamin-independent)